MHWWMTSQVAEQHRRDQRAAADRWRQRRDARAAMAELRGTTELRRDARALGDRALADRAPGDRALGDRALGDRALGDRALGDRALGDRPTHWRGLRSRFRRPLRAWISVRLRAVTGR